MALNVLKACFPLNFICFYLSFFCPPSSFKRSKFVVGGDDEAEDHFDTFSEVDSSPSGKPGSFHINLNRNDFNVSTDSDLFSELRIERLPSSDVLYKPNKTV
jgi:hypothetical protein